MASTSNIFKVEKFDGKSVALSRRDHPITFRSCKFEAMEINYEIHDEELYNVGAIYGRFSP